MFVVRADRAATSIGRLVDRLRRELMSGKLFRIVVGLVVALLPGVASAQTGTITGLVRDSSGAAVPGATVRVVAEAIRQDR